MNVVCEGEHSESVSVESGVPQDTVLGLLMLLCPSMIFQTVLSHKSVSSRMTVFYIGQLKVKEIKKYYRMTHRELEKWPQHEECDLMRKSVTS